MGRKLRIFLLFLLLSILPFYGGGCGRITSGFPLSFMDIPDYVSLEGIIEELSIAGLYEPICLFLINIMIVCLLTSIIVRKEKYIKWIPAFVNALAIHVCMAWLYYCYFVNVALVLDDMEGFLVLLWEIPYEICISWPDDIARKIIPMVGIKHYYMSYSYKGYMVTDAVMRLWFVFLTLAIMVLLCLGGILKNKYLKSKKPA